MVALVGYFVSILVPFAAGNFIYIAGSDLIPEIRKDEANLKKSTMQTISIILGVCMMIILVLAE